MKNFLNKSFLRGLFLFFVIFLVGYFFSLDKNSQDKNSQNTFSFLINFSGKGNFYLSRENSLLENSLLPLLQKNTLFSISCPQNVSPKSFGSIISSSKDLEKKEIVEYVVRKGDSLSKIAQKFNISVETILWANDLSWNSVIRPGQKLTILPTSGVLHLVKKGETLSEIAQLYGVSLEKIYEFNSIDKEGKIYIGDLLIIPGGRPPKIRQRVSSFAPIASNFFICPILEPCRITQGLHWYNAVDFSHGRCGDPVLAAAGGIIQKIGYHKIAGNYIRILHPNGVITFYGHLSKIIVSPGQRVSQGEIIGYIGHSGYTIPRGPKGCHLHFEVRGAKNPFAF